MDIFNLKYILFAEAKMMDGVEYRMLHYAVCGLCVIGFLLVCKKISWLPVISFMGRYSIIILVTHPLVIGISEVLFRRLIPTCPMELKRILMLMLTIIISCVLIPILKAYTPKIVAQKEFFTKWPWIGKSQLTNN